MREPETTVRHRDQEYVVDKSQDPWAVYDKEGVEIVWKVMLSAPEFLDLRVVFESVDDVEYMAERGLIPVPPSVLDKVRYHLEEQEPDLDCHGDPERQLALYREFHALAEREGLDPGSVEAFDAAVAMKLINSLCFYDIRQTAMPITGYSPDLDELKVQLGLSRRWKAEFFTSRGESTIWSWAHPMLHPAAVEDTSKATGIFVGDHVMEEIGFKPLAAQTIP